MPDRFVRIVATETVIYSRSFALSELEAVAGMTFAEAGGLDELVQAVYALDQMTDARSQLQDDLERHGDVQGQSWVAEWDR